MGMWQGILQGMQMIEEKKRLDEEQAFRREQFEFTRENARQSLALQRQRMLADLLPDLTATEIDSSELADLGTQLSGIFGEDSPVVSSIISSGNTEDASRILEAVRENYAAAQEQGRGDEYLRTVSVAFDNIEVRPSTTGRIDTTMVEQLLGQSLEAIGVDLDLTRTIPGSVPFEVPTYQPTATLDDLNRTENRIVSVARDRANQELARIRAATARINSTLASASVDSDTEEALRQDLTALTDRSMQITDAIETASGDNADASGLLRIYGTDARDSVLASSTVNVNVSSLSPTFQENIERAPIVVQDAEQAQRYFEMGIITEADVITFNGRTYSVADLIED